MENFLNKVWKDSNHITKNNESATSLHKVQKILQKSISVGSFYYYVLHFKDAENVTIQLQNETLSDFFNLDYNTMTLEYLMSKIHPDDVHFIQKAEQFIVEVMKHYYVNNFLDFKSSYAFRIKDKTDNYKLILHQMIPIEVDKNGNISHTINIHTNIEHITTTNSRTVSLFGYNGLPSFISVDPFQEKFFTKRISIFTKRELEILNLISEGFTYKEIAKALFISHFTVLTHKKNILKKSKLNKMTEVITGLLKNGVL